MSPRLVLHVGAPKTGSTYLQRRWRAGADLLREHGVYVPVLPQVARMAGNAKLLATVLSAEPSRAFVRAFPEIDSRAIAPADVAGRLLVDWQPDREVAIWSAENFRPIHARRLRALVPAQVECSVVLCIRRQDRWIESYHNQMVKVDEMSVDLASFVALLCETDGERLCRPDWLAHYRAWYDAFGNCRVIFYDEERADLFGAVMRAAGLAVPPGLPDVDPVQVALDAHQLAYLLALERPVTHEEFARRRAATEAAAARLAPVRTRSLLSEDDRARLRARFEDSNRALLDLLGRSDAGSPLDLGRPDAEPASLGEIYRSPGYAAHRALADELFARDATAIAALEARSG